MPALVTAPVAASVAVVGPAVGTVVPGLTVFAVAFTGLVGALVVLAVARSARPRLSQPTPVALVVVAVVAAVAATAVFLRADPDAARYLPPPAAIGLAAVLAGCLAVAVAAAARPGTGRLAPTLGAAGAVVFAGWSLLLHRVERVAEPVPPLMVLLTVALVATPFAAFGVPAFAAARAAGSLRAGLRAAIWTVVATVPLTYAVWLPEAARRHAIDGRTLDGELLAPVGVNLADALVFCLAIVPLFGIVLGAAGAAVGAGPHARRRRPGAAHAPRDAAA